MKPSVRSQHSSFHKGVLHEKKQNKRIVHGYWSIFEMTGKGNVWAERPGIERAKRKMQRSTLKSIHGKSGNAQNSEGE